ncbi:uncharacterized protein EV420DRAFT_1077090 [Desarmillaria tabescens]|uniref:Uncharacterized protein n=1 Tax=Armillaria tabescens TaxID=1929756 RepID=A0AA39JID9_ARMTA|nr:uncharacterized protein EV420DRAFT_1077090 [Desarmillaria tabescens]KAK0442515.1 hypothetical protein EV420DRAFT_1077090 [Desarmillaria tabescens]
MAITVDECLSYTPRIRSHGPLLFISPFSDLYIVRHHSAFGLYHIESTNTCPSGHAEGDLLTGLDGQRKSVSLRFFHYPMTTMAHQHRHHFILPLRVPASHSEPAKPRRISLSPVPPLPLTSILTQDAFILTAVTMLPNLTSSHAPPHLIILLASSRLLVDVSITVSTLNYAEPHVTATLESLPASVLRFSFVFKFG